MPTERDMNLNNAENSPSCTADTVKASFRAWLLSKQGKKTDANTVIANLDAASEQLQKRKIASIPIWEVTKSAAFVKVQWEKYKAIAWYIKC